jgi:hypothetical protein
MVEQQADTDRKEEGVNTQEQFLAYFLRRLEEWERMKYTGAATDPVAAKVLDRAIFSDRKSVV